MSELWQLGVADLQRGYARRAFAPSEVLDSLRARLDAVEPHINAFAELPTDRASKDGPLHGIPVAVKDLFDVRGAVTTAGSALPPPAPAARDAAVVARLRQAGAIPFGRTRTHEFAWGITTQHAWLGGTRNPWNRARIPGGSSGGSAAAVAAGVVPCALGTDTGGSIRIPAAFCGVVGFKPTFGAIDIGGVVPLSPSLDHVGLFARTVEDVALVFDLLAPPASPSSPTVIGIVEDETLPALRSDLRQIFDRVVSELPYDVVVVELPSASRVRAACATIQAAEALDVHRRVLGTWPRERERYGPDVRGRLEGAERLSASLVVAATRERELIRAEVRAALEPVSALLTPVAACGPSTIEDPDVVEMDGARAALRDAVFPFTVMQNLVGLPACVVPVGMDGEGLPVGVQVTGLGGRDREVLEVARELEGRLGVPRGWPAFLRITGDVAAPPESG